MNSVAGHLEFIRRLCKPWAYVFFVFGLVSALHPSHAIFVVYMNGCSMGLEVLNHHPLKFREEANGVWRIRQLAQCFHHSSLALLILAQRVRGIYSHTRDEQESQESKCLTQCVNEEQMHVENVWISRYHVRPEHVYQQAVSKGAAICGCFERLDYIQSVLLAV